MKCALLAGSVLLLSATMAMAQSSWNPSSDDLLRMLKPGTGGPSRGIRPIGPSSAPAATPTEQPERAQPGARRALPSATRRAAAPAEPSAQEQEQGQVNLTVEFETGSARLTPAAERTLQALGRALANPELAQYKFRIIGHTDTVGSPETNQSLSERRAQAVTDYMINRFNVSAARLTAIGMGQNDPLVPTGPGVAEPRNRRVQVVNAGT